MKLYTLLFTAFFAFGARAQSEYRAFDKINAADSITILEILQELEETAEVDIAVMKVYKMDKGYQRIFVWWKVDGKKLDHTRGTFTLDKTQDGVTGYAIDANKKHPKHDLLNDSEFIKTLLLGTIGD